MLFLKRRLYQLILRLHPAAFRNRFAREMSLDFEDALATYGFSRLLLDATRSLARQWITLPAFSAPQRQAPVSSHPLLAGHYLNLDSDNLTPYELLRGSLLFAILLFTLAFALNHSGHPRFAGTLPGLPANQSMAMASPAAGAFRTPYDPNHPQLRPVGSSSASRIAYAPTGILVPGVRSGPLVVGPGTPPASPAVPLSWAKILFLCAIISAIVWITSSLVRRSRSIGVRIAFLAFGLIAVLATALFVPTQTPPAHAQARSHDQAVAVAFDAVSIRQDKTLSPFVSLLQPATPDGYHFSQVPLFTVVHEAYAPSLNPLFSFGAGQIIGAPDWLYSAPYDVDAKISAADLKQWSDLDQQLAMRHAMLQTLLADRLKLITHREMRTMPIFELKVGKNGPKLKPAASATPEEIRAKHPGALALADGSMVLSGPKPGQQTLLHATMQTFAWFLTSTGHRPVQDKTGLKGRYDISYQLEMPQPQQEGSATPSDDSSQIRAAIHDQLGLNLTPAKAPVEVLVIDHIERPSEN